MGGCATKPGELKADGEAPLAAEDMAALSAGEKKDDGLLVAAENDPTDASRRRSLSDLLKENAESDDETIEIEKIVTEESVIATAAAAETKEEFKVQQLIAIEEGTTEELKPKIV